MVMLTTDRAVLLYRTVDGQRRRGSGLRVGGRYVLTADHCANGADHVIVVGGVEYPATVHVRTGTTDVDLAVLVADDLPELEPMTVARLDRITAADVTGCVALGFPSWKPGGDLAQPHGYVPTLEGTNPHTGDGRFASFKITSPGIREYRVLAGALDQDGSLWAGMSGAVVVAPGGLLLGVVCSHAPAEGAGSLSITPLTAIAGLTGQVRERFTAALGVGDLAGLPVLPPPRLATPPGAGLRDLVSVLDGAGLPTVASLDPYRLGASPSDYGTTATYGADRRGVLGAPPGRASWIAAIYRSADAPAPLGAGLVIDRHRVLTAAHVIGAGARGGGSLWVEFPHAESPVTPGRAVTAVRVSGFPRADLAVLELGQAIPEGVEPARLRRPTPEVLVSKTWWTFGFPNGDPFGNPANGVFGQREGHGRIGLNTDSRYAIDRGFSGGGLWCEDYAAVVAVVAQANERGDGRAVTLDAADPFLPEEGIGRLTEWTLAAVSTDDAAAWGWSLETDDEAHRHWRPRARGVTVDSVSLST